MFHIKGGSLYISMTEVVIDDGNTIVEHRYASLHHCEKLCDQTNGCESLRYCHYSGKNVCYLQDKKLNGTEQTKDFETCTSYYKSTGNSVDISYTVLFITLCY